MPGDDPLARVRELHSLAVAENSAGHPLKAARLIRRGLSRVGWDATAPGCAPTGPETMDLTVRLLVSLAKSEFDLRGLAAGLSVLDQATRIAQRQNATTLTVPIANQRGLFLLHSGNLAAAQAQFDAAERAFPTAAPLDQANVLLNRSAVFLERRDLRAAGRDVSRCRRVAAAAGLSLLEGMAVHNEGYLEFLNGNLADALRLMEEALTISDHLPVGVSNLDRARVMVEAGLVAEADEVLAAAVDAFRRDRSTHDRAEAELGRAYCALVDARPQDAARFARQARDRFSRRGDERWRRTAELIGIEAELGCGRSSELLVRRAEGLVGELRDDGLRAQSRRARMAAVDLLLNQRRTDDAHTRAARLRLVRRADPISERMHGRSLRMRLHSERGEAGAARREARAALAELVRYQASFGSIDLRTASALHGRQIAALDLHRAVLSGRPPSVLAAAERGRAVSSRLAPVRPPRDPESRLLLAELRQVVEQLRGVDRGEASAVLEDRRRELERRIRARAWATAGTGAVLGVVSLGALRDVLGASDTVLVSYLRDGSQLFAVAVAPRRTSLIGLGPGDVVDEQVRHVRADLDLLAFAGVPPAVRDVAQASLARRLADLDARLVAPLPLGGSRVVIVPSGLLGTVPWGALPRLRGVPVMVAPSATSWCHAVTTGSATRSGRQAAAPQVSAVAGPDLRRAAQEVRGVVRAWPGARRATGRSGSRMTLAGAMGSATIVHIAAHGTHQTENPLFSSIRLADGPLFAHELDHAPEHVVLSACELGFTTIRPGNEALGLTAVLLHLGARSVVSGVARVADDVAAQLMVRYHALLASGQSSADALAESTAADEASVAPFVCFGSDWSAQLADQPGRDRLGTRTLVAQLGGRSARRTIDQGQEA